VSKTYSAEIIAASFAYRALAGALVQARVISFEQLKQGFEDEAASLRSTIDGDGVTAESKPVFEEAQAALRLLFYPANPDANPPRPGAKLRLVKD
jgi:hypothetical protein